MQITIPEFNKRIINIPISFKKHHPNFDAFHYTPNHKRYNQLARLTMHHARLQTLPRNKQQTTIILSSFPTKHTQINNAVGLNTPTNALTLLDALRTTNHTIEHNFKNNNALIHTLIATNSHNHKFLSNNQLTHAQTHLPINDYKT